MQGELDSIAGYLRSSLPGSASALEVLLPTSPTPAPDCPLDCKARSKPAVSKGDGSVGEEKVPLDAFRVLGRV